MNKNNTIVIRYFFPVILILLLSCGNRHNDKGPGSTDSAASDTGTAQIDFKVYEFDFGKITEGEKVGHIFSFENKGTGNLVITSASTSCGCTVTRYDQNPIPPGKGGILEVVFDSSGRNGIQTKTVSVHSNSKSPVLILKITAEVIPRKPG